MVVLGIMNKLRNMMIVVIVFFSFAIAVFFSSVLILYLFLGFVNGF